MSFNLRILSLTLHCTPHIICITCSICCCCVCVCVIYSLMHSHDVNDSTYFTIVEINGSQTLWHHHPECSWKHLISWKDCSASSLLFALVIPSSHPHLNKKNALKRKMGRKKNPHHAETVTAMKWTLKYSEGDSCPWQFSALQTAAHPAVGHSEFCHHETSRVQLYCSPSPIVIQKG